MSERRRRCGRLRRARVGGQRSCRAADQTIRRASAVALAQSAEHRNVDPKVTGSRPVGHPNFFICPQGYSSAARRTRMQSETPGQVPPPGGRCLCRGPHPRQRRPSAAVRRDGVLTRSAILARSVGQMRTIRSLRARSSRNVRSSTASAAASQSGLWGIASSSRRRARASRAWRRSRSSDNAVASEAVSQVGRYASDSLAASPRQRIWRMTIGVGWCTASVGRLRRPLPLALKISSGRPRRPAAEAASGSPGTSRAGRRRASWRPKPANRPRASRTAPT